MDHLQKFNVATLIEASKNIARELTKNKEKLAQDALENGVCPQCGEPVKSGMWLVKISKPLEEELVLTCPNGHEWSHGVASVILK